MTQSPATSLSNVLARFRHRAIRELTQPVYSLRARSATISFWIVAIALGVAVISAIASGQIGVIIFTAPGAALFVWLLAVLLLTPGVYYDHDRVVVLNFARVHVLPWSTVARIEQGIDLVFTLNDGRKIHAYGSPYPRRNNGLMQTKPQPSGRNYDGDTSILEDFRRNARDTGELATHRWDVAVLVTGAILLVLFVSALGVDGLL